MHLDQETVSDDLSSKMFCMLQKCFILQITWFYILSIIFYCMGGAGADPCVPRTSPSRAVSAARPRCARGQVRLRIHSGTLR